MRVATRNLIRGGDVFLWGREKPSFSSTDLYTVSVHTARGVHVARRSFKDPALVKCTAIDTPHITAHFLLSPSSPSCFLRFLFEALRQVMLSTQMIVVTVVRDSPETPRAPPHS